MQVKRFFAADMRQAMKLVRDELGPDAAILSNRRVAGGVELTAANVTDGICFAAVIELHAAGPLTHPPAPNESKPCVSRASFWL